MANFAFVARDSQGRQVTGTLEGPAAAAVVSELQSRGLAPIRVSETASAPPTGRSVPAARLAAMYRQLADLLRAGVPLLRAIRLLARGKSHRGLSEAMAAVADAVAQGDRLADAMSRFPRTFPSVQVAMIRAGERGGFLEPVLGRLGAFLEQQAQMKGKVLGNLIYPAVLLLVGVGLVVAALVFFVPRFADLFATMDLPLATRILLGLSAWLTTWYPAIPFL
ncbi:MAG: type II secretion system F family protein, partial [Phycisphaerae bacterium]|nr:type II secretion system F family protein [Phycisphaerae bacterium]